VRYLIDANVMLEAALRRQHWQDATNFLSTVPASDLAISLFSLHSIGYYLIKRTPDVFDAIVRDTVSRRVAVLGFQPTELHLVSHASRAHQLDFDDAFVYAVAERDALTIVSFDADFERTPRGRKTPAQVLADMSAAPPPP
jgi:predicted nucleic acid-binding protein